MPINQAGEGNGHLERRRQVVADILIHKPKASQRQIQESLAKQMLNPDTSQPYSLGTINNDIQKIRQQWQEQAIRDYGELVGYELATINEVAEEAWNHGDLDMVLRCSDRRRKLLGMDKPVAQLVDVTTGGEKLTGGITDEQHARAIATLFHSLATRNNAGDLAEEGAVDAAE